MAALLQERNHHWQATMVLYLQTGSLPASQAALHVWSVTRTALAMTQAIKRLTTTKAPMT